MEDSQKLETAADTLTKVIRRTVKQLDAANALVAGDTQTALKNKVRASATLQSALLRQLQEINEEMDNLQEQRQQLLANLQAKMGPLQVVRDHSPRPLTSGPAPGGLSAPESSLPTMRIPLPPAPNPPESLGAVPRPLRGLPESLGGFPASP